VAKATLIDTTNCIGCRSCQVSCKQWNDLPGVKTKAPEKGLGFQEPKVLSAKSYVVVTDWLVDDSKSSTGFKQIFAKRQCMHCEDPACASACPATALHKTLEGPVVYDKSRCIGCRYCMWACPWGVPTAEWDSLNPSIRKCTNCYDRLAAQVPETRNGVALTADEQKGYGAKHSEPACVKQCPGGALKYGERDALLAEAKLRIKNHPGKYVNHIYGEHEAGGTGMLYLASAPFEELGFPKVQSEPIPHLSAIALGSVPPAVVGVGAVLGGTFALNKRREKVAKAEAVEKKVKVTPERHTEFAPVADKVFSPVNKLLMALIGFGGLCFILRFLLGLGHSTGLSDTWAWGLWIVFDFSWIAIAAGAFCTAGIIYVLRRHDLYSIGRTAVLMGFLSYTFVVVTLLADLGLPWHFYSLAMYKPKHSAMFEVSWCIALYLTVLLLEFLPVPLEWFGLKRYHDLWTKYAGAYVPFAIALFVFLLSRNLVWVGLAFVVFAVLAWIFRTREGQKPEPIMLAIAAITFSTMHQSSLGSLYLLMPDKLSHLWWSPIMLVCYFLSSIAAGTSLMILIEMSIAKGYKRALRMDQLAAMGKISFWALLVYLVVRLGDVAMRGNLGLVSGRQGVSFAAEIGLMGLLPLLMLGLSKVRQSPRPLGIAAALVVAGVIWNRCNGVIYGMSLKGPLPQIAPLHYMPTIIEWGISVGMIAATILLFKIGAMFLPILPKEEVVAAQ